MRPARPAPLLAALCWLICGPVGELAATLLFVIAGGLTAGLILIAAAGG